MRRSVLILAAVALVLGSVRCTVAGTPTAYEGFDYPSGSSLSGRGGAGSFGFTDTWSLGGLGSPQHRVGNSSLMDPSGTLPTTGNCGAVISVSPSGFTTARRRLSEPLGTANTRRYLSFLLRPEGTLGQGDARGYFGLQLVGSGTSLFVGKPSLDRYVLENTGGTGQQASTAVPVVGRTALLVLRADFRSGADTFQLYVDPLPGEPEPALPDAIKSDSDVGTVNRIGMFSSGAFSFDEIRIGRSYADVVLIPEPSTTVLLAIGALGALVCLGRRCVVRARRAGST